MDVMESDYLLILVSSGEIIVKYDGGTLVAQKGRKYSYYAEFKGIAHRQGRGDLF